MNDDAYKLFWYFVNERHRIYLKKSAGEPKPWTDDEILRIWKFTNVFRELDRGTIWLREHFREPHADAGALLVFNIAWYRIFNWIPTAEAIGWRATWEVDDVISTLRTLPQVFTNAHMLRGTAGEVKVVTYAKVGREIWESMDDIYSAARERRTLEHVFDILTDFRNIGPFLAYEIVTDLRHTAILGDASDINTWANVGPGAMRGLTRVYGHINRSDALARMRELLRISQLDPVLERHVPPLELRDIEHSLCEYDKMMRVKNGEGTPRCRYVPRE